MSFQTIRRHSSSRQNLKIKELLDRLAWIEASQHQIEDENLILLGFTNHTRIQYHDEVKFTKVTTMNFDEAFKIPIEPDGKDLTLWYRFDGLSVLEDASFFGHTGIQHGDPLCSDSQIIEGMDEGMNMGGNIAVRFNGVNQYVTTRSTSLIDVKDSTV